MCNTNYQYYFCEIPVGDIIDEYSNDNLFSYTPEDERLELVEKLKHEFWELAARTLTDKQFDIIKLMADGYTQQEIANYFGCLQNTISKNINGNVVYYPDGTKRRFGGIILKMQTAAYKSEKIQKILKDLETLEYGEEPDIETDESITNNVLY
jgi:predicted transcriptional regulator